MLPGTALILVRRGKSYGRLETLSEGIPAPGAPHTDFQDLFEHAPCGYLVLAPDGRVMRANATFCVWTGYSSTQLTERRFAQLLNVAGRVFYETHFAPLLRMQGFFHEVALEFVSAAGERLPAISIAVEQRADYGVADSIRVTIFPSPQRRRYERELVEAREKEEQRNAALQARVDEAAKFGETREQFIAVLGHDLRNPLAAVDGGINRLLRDGWTDRSEHLLRLMKASVNRMSGLIDNVLDLARSRLGGGIQLNLDEERPLAETLAQVVEELRSSFPERPVQGELALQGKAAFDHARIAQMMSNLIGNALTHGAPDQPVRVRALTMPNGAFEISVANGGEPIPSELLPHLFK